MKKFIPKKPYKAYNYIVSQHAVDDMSKRWISKGEVGYNLKQKPLLVSKIKIDQLGRPSYNRFSNNKVLASINPLNRKVCSVRNYHVDEIVKEFEKNVQKELQDYSRKHQLH